jgi:acyl-CoA synthetase (AMP-forming)/AMP-acid ligase II
VHRSREYNFAGRLVQRLGENSCLIDASTGEAIPGRDVPDLIIDFAAKFLSSGLQPGDRIVIGCGLNPATALAYLGAMYAGLVPVLTEEHTLSSTGAAVVAKARAKAIWTRNPAQWAGGSGERAGRFHGGRCERRTGSLAPAAVTQNDVAVLMPTSGSTGVPRLVMVTHENLIANTEAIIRSQALSGSERAMLIMPVSYCFGASVMHTHLYNGGSVVFDSRFMFPDKVLRAIDTYGCTSFAGVPTVYNILLRRSNLRALPLSSLRRLLQAGGALAPESIREVREILPRVEFFAMYGQTEATARVACLSVARCPEWIGSVGAPLDNLKIRIADENGQSVANGQTGEIQVQGPSVCAGYADDPEATATKFRDGWLSTGDFGCVDDAGFLWIKGRRDDFVKMRGVRVSMGEVEARVAGIAGVCECAAKRVQHPEAGEAVALFIVAEGGADGILQRVRRALPTHWTCASIDLVAELPKTENGKIARSRLGATA